MEDHKIAINRGSNRMLLSLSQAVVALHNSDHAAAEARTNDALPAIDAIKKPKSKDSLADTSLLMSSMDRETELLVIEGNAFASTEQTPGILGVTFSKKTGLTQDYIGGLKSGQV